MPAVVHALFVADIATQKLGKRGITREEAQQLAGNRHLLLRNPYRGWQTVGKTESRKLMVGRTNGGRILTLVIERTPEPADWQVVTGWDSANHERRML